MEEVSGRTKHKAMVRPALPCRRVPVFFVLAPRPLSLRAGGWRSSGLPHPGQAVFLVTPLPMVAAGGGARHTAPCPKRLPLVRKLTKDPVFFCRTNKIYICCPPPGGVQLSILSFLLPRCCKSKLGGGTAPSLASPLQGKGLWPW